jgi:hypothetical protein
MNGYINKKYSKIKKEDKMKILPWTLNLPQIK